MGITDIAAETEIPSDFALSQNYPNPFNPTTTIEYSIQNLEVRSQKSELVTLKIYDVLGNEITTLVNEYKAPGNYKATFNSTSGGKLLPSGIYFYKLSYNGRAITKKLTLLK